MLSSKGKTWDVIIIGGGASGMMAACVAGSRGKKVLILEKNSEMGKKLKITGGGRCNITNNQRDKSKLLENYSKAKDSLQSAFSEFGIAETFEFFESRNLKLVTEENNRVFPATQKAGDVYNVLAKEIQENKNIEVKLNTKVKNLLKENGKVVGVKLENENIYSKNIIIATGGKSHPETGSTGDAFNWLHDLNLNVLDPTPSLVPLSIKNHTLKSLSGQSIDNCKVTFFVDNKKRLVKKGRILITHFGLSGPTILNLSKEVADLLHEGEVTLSIDLFPTTDHGTLDDKLIKIFDENKNKNFKNILNLIMPNGMNDGENVILNKIDPEKKVHSITKEERKYAVQTLKNLELKVDGLMGYDKAIVADGGVDLRELDMRNFSTKKHPNLFVTGDMLNINRPSGGFSLQLCWTSGYVAGKSI